ncbi:Probable plastid-lipid-associated protein [Seminavis robusta]|uniref:Probable plastid-lipid-associated protein n=1 Tax=Seminavis robusta TaxID=568900 RepID=A0A9N8EGU0_9STRA|nr:Probable plastid-lipid-associated protein [Seminavis robusta]|eukprot:Sro971_g226520.1 Probable plastid-lipid-associated protein (292) ;mRNA; r:37747-38710
MKLQNAILLLASLMAVNAFSVLPGQQKRNAASKIPIRSEPSDSSSDDYFTVEGEVYEPTADEILVSNVIDLMPKALGSVSAEDRSAINEAIYKLESVNPTTDPTLSPLLNGVWELRYWGGYDDNWALPSPTRQIALFLYSGGYSPGVFALGLLQNLPLPSEMLDVGDLEVTISRDQPRVEAKIPIKVGSGMDAGIAVKARLEVESGKRLRETYESATLMEQNVNLPGIAQYSREVFVTYLDNDILVARDGSGVVEVLVRKQKTFSQNWGTEPSDFDLTPPGEGVEFGSPTM